MPHTRPLLLIPFLLVALVSIVREAPAGTRGGRTAHLADGEAARPRIGVFLASTSRRDPAEALSAAKAVGVDLIQISKLPDRFYSPAGAREFGGMLNTAGLQAVSVVIVFDGESYRDLEAVEKTVGFRPAALVDARLAYARKCVDFAAALGIKIVTFHAGVLPKDSASPIYQQMLKAVTSVATYAAARGITVSLETGQETAAELLGFLDAVQGAQVGVNFDTANLVLYGMEDPPDALRRLVNRVTSVHVKDGILPEAPGLLGKEVRLGEGRANVKKCLAILHEAGFTGPLVIENYVSRELKTDPLDELRRARAFVEQTLRELAARPADASAAADGRTQRASATP